MKLKKSRSDHFPIHSRPFLLHYCFSFNQFIVHSFFKQVCFEKKKNACGLLVFFNRVTYMQLSYMIPGVNIIGRKVSVASVRDDSGAPKKIFRL